MLPTPTFPKQTSTASDEESAATAEKPAPVVLVVEDELLLRWAICERFRDDGYAVEEATTAAEAMAALTRVSAADCAIVLDFRLPDMADLTLAKALRAARPDVPIIMMSAHSTVQDRADALNAGVAAFLQKPFDMTTLLRVVRDVRGRAR